MTTMFHYDVYLQALLAVAAAGLLTWMLSLIRRITPLTLMRCEARSGDELLATGELKFYVEFGESSE